MGWSLPLLTITGSIPLPGMLRRKLTHKFTFIKEINGDVKNQP